PEPGLQGRGGGGAAAHLPADVPVGGAHPRVRIEWHPRPARPGDPDDLFDRPRPQHLLLGQAGVRGGGPPRSVARPRRHRWLLPRVHDRRDGAVRAGGPEPLTPGPSYWSAFASAASMAAARSAPATPRGSLPFGQYSSLWTCSSG